MIPAFAERGAGPAVVCSHGMLMDRTMFDPQLAGLADAFRVVAFDSRARAGVRAPYTLDDLAGDCLELLDRLAIERCVLVGMSMGGFMALRFALAHPERLAGLVLIGAAAEPYTAAEQDAWRARYAPMRAAGPLAREVAAAEVEYCFGATFRRERPDAVERWLDRWTTYPGEVAYRETVAWIEQDDVTGRLGEIAVPVLAIQGTEDTAVPLARVRATVDALPRASLVEIDRAGHTPNLERPDAVNAALRAFAAPLLSPRPRASRP